MHVPALLYCAGSAARRKRGKYYLPPPPYLFQVGFTSAPGQGGILAQREFDRRFSPHFVSIFPLVIEIALQRLCHPAQGLFAGLWCVGFMLQSPGEAQRGLQLICISAPEEYHRKSKEFPSQLPL